MRIGLLGGTFNPIHFGHIYPTSEAALKLKLDKVLFVPAYLPPHKSKEKIVSARRRIKMIQFAIEKYPNFELSLKEINRQGVSYSVDTVTNFAEKKRGDNFFFIMGVDAFLEIDTWKNVDRLMKSCNFAVVSRGEFEFSDLTTVIKNLSEKFKGLHLHHGEIEPESGLKCIKVGSTHRYIIPVETKPVGISSTAIREKIKSGQSIKGLAPEKVEIYIEKNGFYR